MWKEREGVLIKTVFFRKTRLQDWGISRHWSLTPQEASVMICLLLAMPVCVCVHVFPSLKPPVGYRVSLSYYPWQSLNREDRTRKHVSARNTVPSMDTHAHIKVTPPAVPQTPFITGDLNLFTMPYMKGAQDLPFVLLQHQLPTHCFKKSSNVSDNFTLTQRLKRPEISSWLF